MASRGPRQNTACWRAFVLVVVGSALLAACAVPAPQAPQRPEQLPAGFPAAFYEQSAAGGRPVFSIDPETSLVVIEARRAGSLAQLGHDHAIASHSVRGYVAPNDGRADFYLRLDELVVDEAELRAQAGFTSEPTAAAVAGTRANMLAQFHAEEHPFAVIAVQGVETDAAGTWLDASVAVNAVTQRVRIPAQIEQGAEWLTATGQVTLEQTRFGIVPLAILNGAIQVQDQVNVRFLIHAHRMPS